MIIITLEKIDKQVTLDDVCRVLQVLYEDTPPGDLDHFDKYIGDILQRVRLERERLRTITGDLQCDTALANDATPVGSDMDVKSHTHIHAVAN